MHRRGHCRAVGAVAQTESHCQWQWHSFPCCNSSTLNLVVISSTLAAMSMGNELSHKTFRRSVSRLSR
jgi:hypothetical protein